MQLQLQNEYREAGKGKDDTAGTEAGSTPKVYICIYIYISTFYACEEFSIIHSVLQLFRCSAVCSCLACVLLSLGHFCPPATVCPSISLYYMYLFVSVVLLFLFCAYLCLCFFCSFLLSTLYDCFVCFCWGGRWH